MGDARFRFSLMVPPDWHLMVPKDPAWAAAYGSDTSVESEVEDGTIQDFVLPFGNDAGLFSLAIYVRPAPPDATVSKLTQDYGYVLLHAVIGDYGAGSLVHAGGVLLPAGVAGTVETMIPYVGPSATPYPGTTTRDDHALAYVLLNENRAYDIVFRGNEGIFERHRAEFACVAASLQFFGGASSASP